jgi:hypothetical protein
VLSTIVQVVTHNQQSGVCTYIAGPLPFWNPMVPPSISNADFYPV